MAWERLRIPYCDFAANTEVGKNTYKIQKSIWPNSVGCTAALAGDKHAGFIMQMGLIGVFPTVRV